MNVLLASSKYMPEYAGSGFRAHNLYRRLSRSHPEISYSVFCGSETANQSAVYEYDGVQVNRIAGKSYETLSQGIIRNYQIFRNFQAENSKTKQALAELPKTPDLIHVFGKNYVTASILDYAYREKIPVLIELCNEMDSPFQYIPFPNRLWVNDQLPDKYRFICISEKLRQVCLANGIPDDHIWCRPNPVDETIFHPVDQEQKMQLRAELTGFGPKDKVISYIAKYRPSKNHLLLLETLKELPKTPA